MTEPKRQVDLATLSPELKQIITEKKVQGQKRLKDWLRLLREVAAFDEATDQLLAKAKKRFILFLVLAIVSGFLTAFTVVLFPVPIVFLVAMIVFIVLMVKANNQKKQLRQIDLSNDFRTVLVPFLQVMAEDINSRGQISMELGFAGPSQANIVQQGPILPGRFKKVVETIYRDSWLRLDAPLIEGSHLLLSIENKFVSHDRHWRNARGKSKHKVKWAKMAIVTAALRPNPNLADIDASLAADAVVKLKVSSKEKGDMARISRKFKFKSITEPPADNVSVDDLVQMCFNLSAMLKPASRVAP
jgi:hypothetical protein